ncbi:MAG: beta-lactamase family protein [Pseudomonadales bacterium]|nr:beta-lactamase family protein [Pseudomonadales bacterium]
MTTDIQGYCDEKFAAIRTVLADSLESGADLGVSFAATVNGEMVVDLWGGHLDEEKTQPWQENTIVNVYSTTKTMSFLCALVLADRGQLDFDAPVASYWPEFAANGKADVPVWHLMNHAAGLSGIDEPTETADLYDWDKICGLLAAQKPWWEPGSATGYHALTQGYLIGEVVRRISGKSIGQFFQDEIAAPLQADFFIGVPASEFHRIGNLIPPGGGNARLAVPGDPQSIANRTFANPAAGALESRTEAWRKAEIPAANGHGNARSVARLQAPLACGGEAFGVRLMSPETAAAVMQSRISGTDLVLGVPASFGLGFGLNNPAAPLSPNANTCYWGGWGGSVILVDQDARATVSFVMNKMHQGLVGDMRSANLVKAFYEAL